MTDYSVCEKSGEIRQQSVASLLMISEDGDLLHLS